MSQNMQMVYTVQGTVGTYIFDLNPTGYAHREIQFTNRDRDVDATMTEFLRGAKSMFLLEFDYVGTTQYGRFGTIWRDHTPITFYPFDENRGTAGSFSCRWVNNFEFGMIGPSWAMGFKGRIELEEI